MPRKNSDFRYYWEKEKGLPENENETMPVSIIETDEEVILEARLPDFGEDAGGAKSARKKGKNVVEDSYTDAVKGFFSRARSFKASAIFSDGFLTVSIKKPGRRKGGAMR
ncbi:MAG TPA: hypothetical protein VI979_00190 [archaeon]|nr:hypothetical protein [archaeon]